MVGSKFNRYPITIEGETVQIGSAYELAIALDVLQGQHDRAALSQLAPHLAEITANAVGFMTVMRSLSIADQIFLIQAIGPDMAGVIQSATRLRDILATMAEPGVEEALLAALAPKGLRQLITTGAELAEVLEWVYGERDALTIELLGIASLRRLCRHASDLSAVLHNLDFALQERLLEELGWTFIVNLVNDGRDLACLLRALPSANSARLLEHFTGQRLVDLIGNQSEWTYLTQRLEPAETELLLKAPEPR
jgi:hypothetical protein